MSSLRAHGRSLIVLSLAFAALVGAAAPVAATEPLTEAQQVVNIALAQKGDRWAFAATGPNAFDCSGLVTYSFRETGLLDRIGGKRRTVAGFYQYFNSLGKADKVEGQPGDLIVWGRNKHMGIYLGNGMAVSTLVNPYGVSVHPIRGYLGMKIKSFLHVRLER
ncbi:MAG: C40 family peptidase [Candidatus Limnocylindrales bacterium]